MMNTDFSQISEHISSNLTDLQNIEQSEIKLIAVIQNELKALQKPNCKVYKALLYVYYILI